MWPITLSGRLPVVALVGRYPANKLIGRDLLPGRKVPKDPHLSPPGHAARWSYGVLAAVSSRYPPCRGQIDHVLLTLSPLYSPAEAGFPVRLACLNHAANVRSEPGSNPSVEVFVDRLLRRMSVYGVVRVTVCTFHPTRGQTARGPHKGALQAAYEIVKEPPGRL